MNTRALHISLLSVGVALACGTAVSNSSGNYTPGFPRRAPACGTCHEPNPGAGVGQSKIVVEVTPSQRSVALNQGLTMTVKGSGGPNTGQGGFAMDATGGSFSAGRGTRTWAGNTAITHFGSGTRNWQFGYTAPGTAGPVDVYAVANMVNGNGNNGSGDHWAFHGFDEKATISTPVRLYVNAAGVVNVGDSCVGGFGNYPVLGAPQSATVGNASFSLEAVGVAPNVGVSYLVGTASPPIDLTIIGVTGCTLHVNPVLVLTAQASGGNAQRAEGKASAALPIPNDPTIKGGKLRGQAVFLDVNSGRAIPVTMTNAVDFTVL